MASQNVSTKEGQGLSTGLPFIARSAIIDNLTASYAYIPEAARYILPFTYGAVVTLDGTTTARVLWQNPPGIIPQPPGSGQLSAVFSDATAGASNGTPAPGASSFLPGGQQAPYAPVVVAAHTKTVTVSIDLPTGSSGLYVAVPTSIPAALTVGITGGITGILYFAQNFPVGGYFFAVPMDGAQDNALSITASYAANVSSATVSLYVMAVGQGMTHVWNTFNDPLFVQPSATAVFPVSFTQPITTQPNTPAGLTSLGFYQVPAVGSGVDIVAGVSGQTITIWGGHVSIIPAGSTLGLYMGGLDDTTGAVVVANVLGTLTSVSGWGGSSVPICSLAPVPLPVGSGLQVFNSSSSIATARIAGTVYYTQA